jgi:hypothetical protein
MSLSSSSPQRIHVIFKTHLDVGFTDFARRVVENYFQNYIPRAVALARELRESQSPERFTWTTGSWLIYEYLEQASPQARREMEIAIQAGDIAWHALPFTTHSENMDPALFRFGLSLSQELDQRFGKRTIAAKMTDVPGHTRGIVPLLADAGVLFLHIGVNGASTPPDVPPVFIWRDPSGAEVMVMYHKGSYGDLMMVPGLEDAIYFAHTGDNLGPQGVDQLHETYAGLGLRFPMTSIRASTLDTFASRLLTVRDSLPVITQEIGDTWIHGAGTDPTKTSRYRALLRLRQKWIETGVAAESLKAFSRSLLLVPEHTWGLDVKTHLADWHNYAAPHFQGIRDAENFQKMEASWQEQREYITQAIEALPEAALQEQAHQQLARLAPVRPDQGSYEPLPDPAGCMETTHFQFTFEPAQGFLTSLIQKSNGKEWAGPNNPLGRFWYQAFSASDYQRFYRQYNKNKRQNAVWAIPDFTKPGLEEAGPESRSFAPLLTWAGQRREEDGEATHLLLLYSMPDESWQVYGAPRALALEVIFPQESPTVLFDLQWFEKTACRLPEALWFSYNPRAREPRGWTLHKLGQWISPLDVIYDGNRHLHAVGKGVRYQHRDERLSIETLDAPLVAPGQPSLLNFNNRQPDLRRGLHFNLFNNLWGTNFPMWFEDDARFRFILSCGKE